MSKYQIADAMEQARYIIQDTRTGSYRHSDDKMLDYFNAAISTAWYLRPDVFLEENVTGSLWGSPPRYLRSDLGDDFPLEDQFFQAVVTYMAGMVGLGDDEYAVDGRAVTLVGHLERVLVGRRSVAGRQ